MIQTPGHTGSLQYPHRYSHGSFLDRDVYALQDLVLRLAATVRLPAVPDDDDVARDARERDASFGDVDVDVAGAEGDAVRLDRLAVVGVEAGQDHLLPVLAQGSGETSSDKLDRFIVRDISCQLVVVSQGVST